MEKTYLLIVLLLVIPIAIAEVNFPTTISVKIITDNVTCSVNVTTEENEHYYNCLSNSTNSFTFNHLENATQVTSCNCDFTPITNMSSRIDNMFTTCNGIVNTCNSISQQYGDANTYYKNYATCNTEFELCKRDKADKDTKITELTTAKSNFDSCTSNLNSCQANLNNLNSIVLPKVQGNASSCNQDLEKTKKGKVIWILLGAGIVGAIAFWRDRSRSPLTQKDKESGLAGTARR